MVLQVIFIHVFTIVNKF